ncbi:glycosyltransferase family 4 protein [Massilia aquatica]|uniref:Glycosyltransferase family 4 protein n=1 Tax=Massilia aquatica TaxID=2609000 RepID=A0ABX0M1J6_9BURK|nr:glycosyltransferase family 4 protein [Massilia aquatica]NHZ41036.1 glycosyltransferase family 4 protein [Massilia aquatica]
MRNSMQPDAVAANAAQRDAGKRNSARICMLNYNAWGVIADLDGKNVHIGGEEVQHALMSRYLARSGHQVTSLVGDFGQQAVEQVGGVTVRKTFALDAGVPGLRFFAPRLTATWAGLKAAAADVYYVSCAGASVGIVAAFCQRHGRRLVFRIASDADCAPDTLMLTNARDRALYHYGLRRADAILAQTDKQAALLLKNYGLHAEVAGMFSDLPETVLAPAERATDLLWLANMRSMKRPEWFIDMVRALPELACEMAGGANPAELDLYARTEEGSRALPNLRFHGQVKFGTTRSLFARARIFVNTSSFEGFPNTYLQAWANGVPVVATFDPDGIIARLGLGVAVSDVAGAVAAARALLADPAGLAACSARCRAYAITRLAPETVSAPYLAALLA